MTIRLLRAYATGLRTAVALMVGLAAPGGAQEDASTDEPLAGAVEVYLGVTELAGVAAGQAGFAASLDVGHGLRVGGGAWSILRRVDEGPVLEDSGLELGLGYGGAFVEYALGKLPLSTRLLLGGGVANLRTVAVGTRFDTETFVVVEPALVGHLALPGPFGVGGVAGYRWIHGADGLFVAGGDDLDGFRASVFLRVGH